MWGGGTGERRTERVASAVGGDGPVAGRPQEDVVAALVHHVEVVPVLALPRSRGRRSERRQSGKAKRRRSKAAAHLVDDGVSRAGRDLDHAVNDHLLLSVGEAAMHARAVAVISTAGCQSPLLTPPGMRLRQQRAGGRTVRAARSSQCPRRCAPAPPAAWGSWEACSLGPPSHQPPAGPCEVCVEQNMGRAVAVHAGGGREEAHLDDCTPLSHGNPLRHRE